MRVDPRFAASPLAAAAQRRAAGPRFAPSDGASGPTKASAPAPSAPLATVDALLALQGEEGAGERRRRGLRRGHALLDGLDRLKAALLSGRVPVADLRALAARLAEARGLSGDPGLDDILAQVDLRAQVELAKLGATAQA